MRLCFGKGFLWTVGLSLVARCTCWQQPFLQPGHRLPPFGTATGSNSVYSTWWGRAAGLVSTCDLWSFVDYGSPYVLQDLPLLPWWKNELILPEKPFPP